MSSIKLKHASGNSMSIAAPATNPASDLSLKLPATVGSANQLLKNSGTAGTLEFASNVTVDSNGRLLVGTTSPGESNGDEATFYNNGNAGITIRSAADADCKIYFSEGTSGGSQYRGAINYDHDTHYMSFSANENERIRILGTGGITFNGDTATANALDDYEEGTWTPAADTGTVSATYANYIKIGSMVTIFFDLHNFSNTSSSSHILISGLPFAPVYPGESTGAVHGERVDAVTIVAWIDPSPQKIGFRQGVGSSNYSYITHSNINDGTDCNIKSVMTYRTAA
tara:strand:- start:198 stop:1049 length:852 start_codon:yes stop_codon:yes gene_type:complete